jgi:hypothetical protein
MTDATPTPTSSNPITQLEQGIKNFVSTVETDITAAWKGAENFVESEAQDLWNDGKALVTTLLPEEYTKIKQIGIDVLTGINGGQSIEELETTILNEAEVAGVDFLDKFAAGTLQAMIAVWKAGQAAIAAI